MKTLFLILLSISFIGCGRMEDLKDDDKTAHYGTGLQIVSIDSCEYVLYQGWNSGDCALVHSGNCHNPNHKK